MQVRTPTALGSLIRARRRELNLDQSELAARVGTSRQWIIAVEKGKPKAELGLVLRTLAALKLTLDAFPEERSSLPATPAQPSLPEIDIDQIVNRAKDPRS